MSAFLSLLVRSPRARRARQRKRHSLLLSAVGVLAFVLVAAVIVLISPDEQDRPAVTVYMPRGCATCLAWVRYLNRNGFRATVGAESEWADVRSRVRLAPALRAPHTALVEGLFIEGHVPAREIHKVLKKRSTSSVKGILVAGAPRGAPGVVSAVPEPYVVFLVHASGLLEPIALYNHAPHL